MQSQLWYLPCSVSFEKCSGCCRIQPGPSASCCAKENIEVIVCCRKEMSVLWYKPTSVPCQVLPGSCPGSAQPRAGRAVGFTGIYWDLLGFIGIYCLWMRSHSLRRRPGKRQSPSVPGAPPSPPCCSWAVPGPGSPRGPGRILTVEAVGSGDQAQQEEQDSSSQRDPDQGTAGTWGQEGTQHLAPPCPSSFGGWRVGWGRERSRAGPQRSSAGCDHHPGVSFEGCTTESQNG